MTTCQGSALLLGIEHLDGADRGGVSHRPARPDGCDDDRLLRLLGAELHRDPLGVERML